MEKLLLKACQNGQKGVVTTFLKKEGINVNAVDEQGFAPIHYVCKKGYRDIVKLLVAKDADVNIISNQSITPLHMAATSGNKEIIRILADAGADIDATDREGKTALVYAVCAGKAEAAKYLIGIGADTSVKDNQGRSAFDYANSLGLVQLMESMSGGNGDNADSFGNTPLHHACYNNQGEMVKAILDKGDIDINAHNDKKLTPLYIAVTQNNNIMIAELLIEAGADVNCSNNEGRTPLVLAENLYSEALCMALKEHGAEGTCSLCNMDLNNLARITSNAFASFSEDEMDNKSIALYLARKLVEQLDTDDDDDMECLSGIFYNALANDKGCEVLDICYKGGIDFTAPVHSGGSVTCLRDECISRYNTGVIKKFISFGIDINEPVVNGKTPAFIVASLQKRNMMYGRKDDYYEKAAGFFSKESMEYASNDGTTAMHQAARNNHSGMLKVMIEKGTDVNITGDGPSEAGNTPLHTACIYGSTDAAKVLIGNGADDSMQNADGETPAHFAVMKKKFGGDLKTEERKALLKELKNLDIARNDGKTPLMVLQYMDLNTNTSLLPLFLERGVDVNHKDNYGNTVLILNTQNRCYKGIVKELVRAGADVNAIDNNGNNALYYALEYGNQEVARFLIKKGADYNRANNKGITPAQLIVEKGYDTLLGLFLATRG